MFISAAIGPVAGALAGGLFGGSSSGGTTTQSKDPWSAAVPWLTSNLQTGQNLQNSYAQNPFNPIQQASYGNLLAGNNYINNMVPGLLGQFSQSGGFDRSNPRARPQAMQFPAYSMAEYQPVTGGLLAPSLQAATTAGAAATAPAASPATPDGTTANPFAGATSLQDLLRLGAGGAGGNAPGYGFSGG